MAFFDDFSKHMDKIKKGAQKTAELAKMQHLIGVNQSEFDRLFGEIGKLYYSSRQRGVAPDESMDALCNRVDALSLELSDLKKKVDELRQVNRCPECGAEQPLGNAYCSNCGTKLPEKTPAAEQEEAPAEEENRDVYINWPDGSVKEEAPAEEAETDAQEPAEKPAQEGCCACAEDESKAEEAPEEN